MDLVSNNYLEKQIRKIGCYLEGDFVLKSGQKSSYYIDLRKLISYPELMKDICGYIYHTHLSSINNLSTVRIVGVPYGAIPCASTISTMYNIPLLILRKEEKQYGTKKLIDGEYNENDRVIVIEDVVTSGSSVLDVLNKLKSHKLNVIKIVALFDRGGIDNIAYAEIGANAHSIFNYIDFKKSLKDKAKELMKTKSNLVFSNDLVDKKNFLIVLEQVAPYISFLKIHSDTIVGFDMDFVSCILKLKMVYGFMIIEDRKFADIGSIVKQQICHNRIHQWADIVTVHCVAGASTIQGVVDMDMDMLLIAQMSSKDNLISNEYTRNVVMLAQMYKKNVVGFISQQALSSEFLTFTPGVNIHTKTDNLGQTYSTPESLKKTGTDLFIVGRGIYKADTPSSAAKQYMLAIN